MIDIENSTLNDKVLSEYKQLNEAGKEVATLTAIYSSLILQTTGSHNLLIENCSIYNCYRNGITLGGVYNVQVKNCHIYEIKGGFPQAGIDIESAEDYPNNKILIEGCNFHDCASYAIIGSTNSYNITIRNCEL
jgi:hypothetical protein